MTVAGILGAAVVPQAVARRDRRRALLQVTVGVTIVAFAVIAVAHPVGFVAVALFAEGFVLLAALPVVLDWSELHTGPERAGAAVGFLLLAGNLGGVVLVADRPGRDRQSVPVTRRLVGGRAGRAGAVHQAARPGLQRRGRRRHRLKEAWQWRQTNW